MDGLLVLLLLLSPVLYPGLAIVISLFVGYRVRRKGGKEKSWKPVGAGMVTFVVIMLIPTWNILIVRGYMYYSCWQDGGVHVYQNVEIPPEYFNEYGYPMPETTSTPGSPHINRCFGNKCYQVSYTREVILNLPPENKISRRVQTFKDSATGKLLGVKVTYIHNTWYALDQAAAICPPSTRGLSLSRNVFIPSNE